MLKLRPYKACDALIITNWIKDEYSFRQWCADRYDKYPICAYDINRQYDNEKNNVRNWAMTVEDENGVIGHFIMRYTDGDKESIRLGFVIIDIEKRGKGYGKEMVTMASKYAFEFLYVNKVTLGVFENNVNARHCYESCGFKYIQMKQKETYKCLGEDWNCLEMELLK